MIFWTLYYYKVIWALCYYKNWRKAVPSKEAPNRPYQAQGDQVTAVPDTNRECQKHVLKSSLTLDPRTRTEPWGSLSQHVIMKDFSTSSQKPVWRRTGIILQRLKVIERNNFNYWNWKFYLLVKTNFTLNLNKNFCQLYQGKRSEISLHLKVVVWFTLRLYTQTQD